MAYLDYEGLKRYDTKIKNYVAEQRKPIPVICSIHDWQSSWGNSALTDAISGTSYTPDEYGHKALMPVAAFSGKFGHLLSAGDILLVTIATSSNYNYSLDYISNYSGKMWLAFDRFNGGSLTSTNGLWLTIPNLPTGQNHSFAFVIHDSGAALIDYDRLRGWSDCNGSLLIETRSYDTDSAMDTHLVVNSTYGEYSCIDADQAVKWGTIDLDDSYEPLMGVRVSSSSASTELKPAAVISSMGNTSAKLAYNGLFITDSGDAYANLKSNATLFLGDDSGVSTLSPSALSFDDDHENTIAYYSKDHLEFQHNDIYSIGVSSNAFWIEASSSDLSIDDGGISILNYGAGDIAPYITLQYQNSYDYTVTMYADDTSAVISCSGNNESTQITTNHVSTGGVSANSISTYRMSLPQTATSNSTSGGSQGYVPVASGDDGRVYWSRPPVYKSTTSSNAPYYPILSANATTGTDTTYYVDSNYYFNPSTHKLYTPNIRVTGCTDLLPPSNVFTSSGTYQNSIYLSQYYSGSTPGSGTLSTRYWIGKNGGTSVSGSPSYNFYDKIAGLYRVTFGATGTNTLFSGSRSITGFILSPSDVIEMPNYYAIDAEVYDKDEAKYVVITTYRSFGAGVSMSSGGDGTCYLTCTGTVYMNSSNGWRPTVHLEKLANYKLS
jgi:hypothetical protein